MSGYGGDDDQYSVPVYMPPVVPLFPLVPVLPIPQEGGVTQDNVWNTHQPTSINSASGTSGTKTEWDAASLDGAISWLEDHSKYLGDRLLPAMPMDIKDRLMGPFNDNGRTSFGSYPAAGEMARKHLTHFDMAEQSVRSIAEALWQAAQTLRQVKEQYESAEGANEMSAAAFEQVFAGESAAGRYGDGRGAAEYDTTAQYQDQGDYTPPSSSTSSDTYTTAPAPYGSSGSDSSGGYGGQQV
ncbi:hypothetical protein ACIA8K_32060 [Catenuloplanes sp. NPDC051500]|uniref:hypothetical protein n=1 Tax=Catenuloplanes sp. NPDC051500 TaxID=3363959 RepID=UPI00379763D1